MKLLDNKVAIIIGASSGIGRATATLFAAHGAAVVINARGEKALDEVAGEISGAGGRVHAVAGDAASADLAAIADVLAQQRRVLVIDLHVLFLAEGADLLLQNLLARGRLRHGRSP